MNGRRSLLWQRNGNNPHPRFFKGTVTFLKKLHLKADFAVMSAEFFGLFGAADESLNIKVFSLLVSNCKIYIPGKKVICTLLLCSSQ